MPSGVQIRKAVWIYLLAFVLMAITFHADAKKETQKKGKTMFAIFETSQGTFKVQLFSDKSPKTVENFVGLAKGTKEWTDPKTGKKSNAPFYDGLTFHRVIPDFMIQGGCPLGTGTGGPGYQFEDEFKSGLTFNKKYLLAMANAGPNTNGSQFFVTVARTEWLDNKHTIFGEVVSGTEVVDEIALAKAGGGNKPLKPITFKVKIEEK